MQNNNQSVVPAGSIGGVVRSFVEVKAFGFIDGDDGKSYFVHLNDVRGSVALVAGQQVTFVPTPSRKGSKAMRVIPGQAPTAIYVEPKSFVVTNAERPVDEDVILVLRRGWAESHDINDARQALIEMAMNFGANAITSANMDRFTEKKYFSKDKYLFRYSGTIAVVKAVEYSADPAVIADAQQRMNDLFEWWAWKSAQETKSDTQEPTGAPHQVPSANVQPFWMNTWDRTCAMGKDLYLSGRHVVKKAVTRYKGENRNA
ncbi:cold-shock protein [Pseudomonas frederiksbergensis]